MISLAIDVGNTRTKYAVFDGSDLQTEFMEEGDNLMSLIRKVKPEHAVMSAVGAGADEVASRIIQAGVQLLRVNHETPFPFKIRYDTPYTLGMDRVAGIAAAQELFPETNCLVIDAGTCITYDFISDQGIYSGGAIAPGLKMRLRAMHEFTHKLPLPPLEWPDDLEGRSTVQSLLSGACIGTADEINGRIGRYTGRYGHVQVLLCGGDTPLLAEHIKNNIFAAPSLIMSGLNKILLFNVSKG